MLDSGAPAAHGNLPALLPNGTLTRAVGADTGTVLAALAGSSAQLSGQKRWDWQTPLGDVSAYRSRFDRGLYGKPSERSEALTGSFVQPCPPESAAWHGDGVSPEPTSPFE